MQEDANSCRGTTDKDRERAEIRAKVQEHVGEQELLPLVTLALDMEADAYPQAPAGNKRD